MNTVTGWLKTPAAKTGRDHLGVQGPCINLYGRLLPGITNVTDRARYYTFYPWFLWACDQQYKRKTLEFIVDRFRRADCLFTLIAARHSRKLGELEDQHGIGMIGRNTLIPALKKFDSGNTINFSDYATREDNDNRYFKNKYGGLGQYYAGPLKELGILDGEGRTGYKYTHERAEVLAKSIEKGVNQALFFQTIENGKVTPDILDKLSDFCPCQLINNPAEQSALLDLFFDRKEIYGDTGLQRKYSLTLLLYLIHELTSKCGVDPFDFDHFLFRSIVYTGYLPGKIPCSVPYHLNETLYHWGIYERNELLSIAMQGIFWVVLSVLKEQEPFPTVESFSHWFCTSEAVIEAFGKDNNIDFPNLVKRAKERLVPIEDWENKNHEIALGRNIIETYKSQKKERPYVNMLRMSVDVLINLCARDNNDKMPYGNFDFPEKYFSYYPINLESLRYNSSNLWNNLKLKEVIYKLAGQWGIENHFRVVLHKLRYDIRDTFQVRPTEQGLKWIDSPEPIFTTPRFNQAARMLRDIGAIEAEPNQANYRLTKLGKSLL